MNTATKPKERGIIMAGESVRAILGGRKTQTRRVVKRKIEGKIKVQIALNKIRGATDLWGDDKRIFSCPYGVPGDRLWVKENWYERFDGLDDTYVEGYCADGERETGPCAATAFEAVCRGQIEKKSSMLMPRWASRITLEIVHVRVERVQEISGEDLEAEGFPPDNGPMRDGTRLTLHGRKLVFAEYWDSINAKRGYGWESNPWVWALTFKRIPEGER